MHMIAIRRRELLVGVAALALVGCNGAGGGAAISAEDMTLGMADAPVTLIEYASTTCGHCARFHEEEWEQLKTNYIDTGKIRFVFREYPTDPAAVAVAGFQLARCNGATSEQYMTRVGELFRQQRAIFETGSMEGIRGKLIEIGGAAGLSETQVMACINDQAGAERVRETVAGAEQFGITGTPTFILNGRKVEEAPTYENLARLIDAELAN
jgi:protein-disulfide isomerase